MIRHHRKLQLLLVIYVLILILGFLAIGMDLVSKSTGTVILSLSSGVFALAFIWAKNGYR